MKLLQSAQQGTGPHSVVATRGLQSLGSVVAHGLRCSVARGNFWDQEPNLCLPHWKWILTHCVTKEVGESSFN